MTARLEQCAFCGKRHKPGTRPCAGQTSPPIVPNVHIGWSDPPPTPPPMERYVDQLAALIRLHRRVERSSTRGAAYCSECNTVWPCQTLAIFADECEEVSRERSVVTALVELLQVRGWTDKRRPR